MFISFGIKSIQSNRRILHYNAVVCTAEILHSAFGHTKAMGRTLTQNSRAIRQIPGNVGTVSKRSFGTINRTVGNPHGDTRFFCCCNTGGIQNQMPRMDGIIGFMLMEEFFHCLLHIEIIRKNGQHSAHSGFFSMQRNPKDIAITGKFRFIESYCIRHQHDIKDHIFPGQ